jgi:hypothetical protein
MGITHATGAARLPDPDGALAPETLLRSQFDDMRNAGPPPVHRLMVAVLADAIRVYRRTMNRNDRRSRRLRREIQEWFASDDDTWPFAFVVVCQQVELEPAGLRAALLRWRSHCDAADNGASPPRGTGTDGPSTQFTEASHGEGTIGRHYQRGTPLVAAR